MKPSSWDKQLGLALPLESAAAVQASLREHRWGQGRLRRGSLCARLWWRSGGGKDQCLGRRENSRQDRSILSSLDPLTFLVAINAVYFKDFWSERFMPELTCEELFHTSEGQKLKIPLMSQYGSYSYYEDSKFQAVCLP